MENTNTHLPEFSRCNHVKENSNSNWLKKLLASWLAIRVSKYPSIKVSKHPTNQLRVWVLRRRRNCSYALICTSFDFLVYGALIHRDCFIIYLLSVFFLQSVGRKKREEKLPMPSRRFDSNRTDRSMCLYWYLHRQVRGMSKKRKESRRYLSFWFFVRHVVSFVGQLVFLWSFHFQNHLTTSQRVVTSHRKPKKKWEKI